MLCNYLKQPKKVFDMCLYIYTHKHKHKKKKKDAKQHSVAFLVKFLGLGLPRTSHLRQAHRKSRTHKSTPHQHQNLKPHSSALQMQKGRN